MSISRRRSLSYLVLSLFCLLLVMPLHADGLPVKKLTLSGPAAGVSNGLIHLVASGGLSDIAEQVDFVLWSNPDQLRALTLAGNADFMALPSNVAANLYNRGVPLQLLNVSHWGVLWMISRDANKRTLADFKGEEIAIPFRADMPDIVFTHLAEKQGIDPKKDFKLNYSATPMDAMQLLIMRRVDHALLAEPAVSMALRKTKSFPISIIAPELYRSVDLQQEWGRLMGTEARIPQAGIAVLGDNRNNPELVRRFAKAFRQANQWCLDNAEACGKEVAAHIKLLMADAVADSIGVQNAHFASAAEARPELEAFYQILLEKQPASVGGKLPDDGFYFVDNE
jgi:NitT/TauT family transport system substrate-binding protein